NIAHKIFLQQPDYLGVWGEQSYLFARLLQKLPADKIFVIGSPRFEVYRQEHPSKEEARRRLNLPLDKPVLLFAGAGVVFDEVSLIEEFESAAARGLWDKEILLLYKPHP